MPRGLSFTCICPRFQDKCERHEQLKFGCSMTHATSIMAVFTNTVIPSRYPRTIIRRLQDGIARASRSRDAFVRQSGSFLFLSYCLPESKNALYHPWSYEIITMMSRFDKMPLRWPYEGQNGHTKSTRNWAFERISVNFLHAKDFAFANEVAAETWKIQPAVTRWVKVASRMARSRPDPNLNIFIFMCPSTYKFGTVWRLHKAFIII